MKMEARTKLEIYPHRKKAYEIELKLLTAAKISKHNKELITQFQNYIFSTGSGELRVAKLSSQLRTTCRWLKHALNIDKDLDQLTKTDLISLISFISRLENRSDDTRQDYKRAIKQFYRWYKEEDPRVFSKVEEDKINAIKLYNYLEKQVSSQPKLKEADPLTVLTEQDIELVVEKGAKTPKEKAFISCLHEFGCRAGEFLRLRLGEVILKENHAEIHIPDGKTGRRVVYAVKSLPYLLRYLDIHAYKDNKHAYLWLSDSNNNLNEPLLHNGAQKLIDRCFERAGVEKRHNFHWFRHSRATLNAPKMTTPILCKYMGWSLSSKQPRRYIHLCNEQLEDVVLNMHGMKSQEKKEEMPITCSCGALNKPTERYCFKCFRPLRVETVIQDQEIVNTEINDTVKFMLEMAKNPELMKAFEQFKKQQGQKQ